MTPVHPRLPPASPLWQPRSSCPCSPPACRPRPGFSQAALRPSPSGGAVPDFRGQPRIPPEEHLRHATQDSARVPEKADALLLVHPFATNQPPGHPAHPGPDLRPHPLRRARPAAGAGRPDGTPYLGARMTHQGRAGVPHWCASTAIPAVDSADGVYQVRWDTLGPRGMESRGRRGGRISAAQRRQGKARRRHPAHHAARRRRRVRDHRRDRHGMAERHPPAKLNAWTARNSLYARRRRGPREADRLAAAGSARPGPGPARSATAHHPVPEGPRPAGIAREERRLGEARAALAAHVPGPGPAPASAACRTPPRRPRPPGPRRREQASQAPPGCLDHPGGLLEARQ